MTVLQELKWFVSDGLDNFDESIKVSEIWSKINELLEKEKQEIINAFEEGINSYPIAAYSTGEEYYNSNYN